MTKLVNGERGGLEQLPTILESMKLLAEAYSKDDKSAQAHALQESIEKVEQVAYGAGLRQTLKDDDVAARLLNVARSAAEYARLGEKLQAEKLVTEALEGYGRVAGAKDSTTILIGNTLV